LPSVYELKPRFQALLRPGVRALARAGVTANQVTVAAAALSGAAGAAIAALPHRRWPLLLLPLALLLRMALNAVDGMLAREHGQASRLGALLNELGDVVSDAALYLPLVRRPELFPPAAVVAIVLLAALSELAGVLGQTIGASRRYDGPGGKSDRALVFGALGLALGLGAPGGLWLEILVWLLAAAVALTVVNRCRRALDEAARPKES
jgi:CDP-diacylglycerol--glycerol-3-phosphate 3-phosphatidyltransferase